MTNNPLVEALREARAVLKDPCVGTIHHDDPDWYASLDAAVAKIDAALASSAPATAEREQIVEWLRGMKDAPGLPAFGFKPHYLQGIYADGFADAIARGDHLTQSGEMEGGEHD